MTNEGATMNQPSTLTAAPPAPAGQAAYERCQECGAPLDRLQRYCVNCAARSGSAPNPSSRYFAAATRQRRRAAATPATPPQSGGGRAAAVFFFTLLPIAVAVGVMVGRNGSGTDDSELAAALREGGLAAASATPSSGGPAEQVSNNPSQLLTSDFTLDEGFTVKIGTLPITSTDQAAADDAKSEAEGKGAKDVGIINPGDYRTTPDQGQQDYILYSGEFKDKASAEKALGELKKSFPDAEVIAVSSSASAGGGASEADAGKVVAQTSHGTLHEVSTAPPSDEKVKQDTNTVNQIANQTGKDYTDTQESLPDVTVVGGDPNDAPPLPTGGGD
jgi:hypothetical protein